MRPKTLSKVAQGRITLLALFIALGVSACGGAGNGNSALPNASTNAPNSSPPAHNVTDVSDNTNVSGITTVSGTTNVSSKTTLSAATVRVEAEDYDAYHDNTPGNEGGAYRSDNVDIEITTDEGGGYNVGWTEPGEWLEYEVLLAAGTYEVYGRVASEADYGAFSVAVNGPPLGGVQVGNTGGWEEWGA